MKDKIFINLSPYHPYLFGLYPVLSYFSHNIAQVEFAEVWRALIGSIGFSIVLTLFFQVLTKSKGRAALISSLLILILFSFGQVYQLLLGRRIGPVPLDRVDVFAAFAAAGVILGPWSIWRILKPKRVETLNSYFNLVSLIAIIFPLIAGFSFVFRTLSIEFPGSFTTEGDRQTNSDEHYPDIYYIILDSYGRSDFLQNYYDFDNSEFVDFLRSNGFYIADNSHSNYNQTALSLSSSLNYEYLDTLLDEVGSDIDSKLPSTRLIRQNRLADFMRGRGYTFIAFSSGYSVTEIYNADIYVDTSTTELNNFEKGFLVNTFAVLWLDKMSPIWYRYQLMNTLDQLGQSGKIETETPKFIFAHILMPHPPFVFGPNGEHLPIIGFLDGNYYNGKKEEYIEGYKGQLTYLNKQMIAVITQILETSESDPIIILQGDHGPGAYLDWQTYDQPCLQERMGILNAYHLPGEGEKQLYSGITPVNTFRIVLNEYFDGKYELLEDKQFFSTWSTPYRFTDVTTNADQCKGIAKN